MRYERQLARPRRIDRIARKYARRAEKLREIRGGVKKPFARKLRGTRVRPFIAYDFETTRIQVGTPQLRYFTAYSDEFEFSGAITTVQELADVLREYFLTEDMNKMRFVGWNSNHYDAYFIGAALLHCDEFIIRPYLTRSKSLRGMKIIQKNGKCSWEFLDGLSMTGLDSKYATTTDKQKMGSSLREFLRVFAPQYQKLDAPDWEVEEFDAENSRHVEYAERDSEGLWHGLMRAQEILKGNFDVGFQPTMGNTAIKIFQANMPEGVNVWEPNLRETQIIREFVMRGGYCCHMRKYEGPIWKYDLNQAYAAAMRDTDLPAGRCMHSKYYTPGNPAILRVTGRKDDNKVPFYYRDGELKTHFAEKVIEETWLTSIEVDQLISEGWQIDVLECYTWEQSFRMDEYVNRLEKLRMEAPDGPNGALGLIVKQIGNSSYGKTVETLDGIELLLSKERPEGFSHYQAEEDELQHVWFKLGEPQFRDYHRPQIGAFITAHVRMVVRQAILLAPESWIYADTDCVVFDCPVKLDCDPKKYGKWKVENEGDVFQFIRKKVYASADGKTMHAKGLNVRRLTTDDFKAWYKGYAPRQVQLQRMNFLKVMTGAEMFVQREKVGERVESSTLTPKRLASKV